jgi:aminomethyltransferase
MPVTPLRELHESLGARFTDFGGWDMPVQYAGVIAEHMAVRESVGVFDVSHLGRFEVRGPGAIEMLRGHLCNDIAKVEPGRAQYTMALNNGGGVIDDIIVWYLDDEHFWVMPNGVNFDDVMRPFMQTAPQEVTLVGVQDATVLVALQGPNCAEVAAPVLGVIPPRFGVEQGEYRDGPFWVAGTGYTGERGIEVAVPKSAGKGLFRDLIDAGAVPCGLGARDTLRLEMGYLLWGQDVDESTTPLEAGLGWVVDWDHDFIGREALVAERTRGVSRSLVAFRAEGRKIPRPGYPIRSGDSVGTVSSGNFSPVLRSGIGMGYLTPTAPANAGIEVQIRGTWIAAERVTPPFIAR